ncbi:hypothetical protein A2707_04505 [Candidatus Saccharibacteria bacterium RIFCSPHIGHO2_01_FULL_45_15]|nr:MAG: hypothetical protein A2707_04505 [Candidatus Saccharibacteria bacterium RIFCSPHIGHO2_01_FULL_45_15]OGL27194.1 MAG: hypothetical protein A3C39_01390 [Candidatus Saccharibacteria bacterium RIFCSPHIGHO2_02_FULL_46_12]OGL32763.1 MAG: hypothetical protein A3E76_05455 [Candidatus Saccharibacteria bacterium RIFCSPHIGHO2_12_FULL_44_22]
MTNIENTPLPSDDHDQYDSQLVENEITEIIGSTASNRAPGLEIAQNKSQEVAEHADTLRSFGGIAFEATNADPYYDVELKGTQEALGPFSPTEQSSAPAAHDTEHPVAS